MDELFSSVRELAPAAEARPQDVATARERLQTAMAEEQRRSPRRPLLAPRPVTAGPGGSLRRGLRLHPLGIIAAATAVAIVAVIAVGALLSAQLLSRPIPDIADDWAQVDLSRPLLEQARPGQYVRVARATEEIRRGGEGELGRFSADSAVTVRSVSAEYLSADAPWQSVLYDDEEVLDATGPDGEAIAAEIVLEDRLFTESRTPEPGWLEALPSDGDGLAAAFSERGGVVAAPADESWLWFFTFGITDPAFYAITAEQRAALVDWLTGASDVTRTDRPDGGVELSVMDGAYRVVFDGVGMLPVAGSETDPFLGEGADPFVWTTEITIVDGLPGRPKDMTPSGMCAGVVIPEWIFERTGLRDSVEEAGRAALSGEGVPDLADDEWYAVSETDDRVVLWSSVVHLEVLLQGDVPDGHPGPTHELMTIVKDGSGWRLAEWTTCVMEQALPGHDLADVALDPARPPSADATELHFLVTERVCSAEPLGPRETIVESEQYPDALEVLIAIRPPEDPDATCAAPQTVPFTWTLDAPFGDRPIRDLTYYEDRRLNP